MAVPARRTSKTKRLRRTHEKLKSPEISFDENLGDYRKSHHVSLKAIMVEKVMDKNRR